MAEDPESLCDRLPCPPIVAPDLDAVRNTITFGTSLTAEQHKRLISLLHEYLDILSKHFFDVRRTSVITHRVDTGEAAHIKCRPYRHVMAEQRELDKMISAFLDAGLIRESTSPWSAPVVMVRKKDGTHRFCVDWRRLNSVTRKDIMPLPRCDDSLARLHGSRFFSTLDFLTGFYQIIFGRGIEGKDGI